MQSLPFYKNMSKCKVKILLKVVLLPSDLEYPETNQAILTDVGHMST